MTWNIKEQTVLITGGASGLGALYAEAFLKEGAKNVAIIDISEDAGKAFTARMNARYPGKVTFFKCDVGVEAQIAATFDKVITQFKTLDVLINNAGIMSDNANVVWKACEVNWPGLVSFTMRAVNHMSKADGGIGGTIVNISSAAGLIKVEGLPAYCGSKAAIVHFGRNLAEEPFFKETGIRILTLCPGATDTPLLQGIGDRCYNKRIGERLEKKYTETPKIQPPQKPESAVAGLLKMYKEGENGSVWISVNNKPTQDITSLVKKATDEFTKVVLS